MKLRYLWKITLDNEWKQGIRSFFNVILYIVGITIIGLLVYFVSLETDTKKSVERSIRKEIKTLGSISIEGNPSDIQYNSNFNLLKVVKSFSGIDACSSGWGNGSLAISGDWRIEYDASEYRDEDLKLLQDIQKKNVYDPGYAIQGKSLETTWLDAGAWDMMKIDLLQGRCPSEIDYALYGDAIPIYLGYRYKDKVQPGTRLIHGEEVYVVEGILKKNSVLAPNSDDLMNMYPEDQNAIPYQILDYSILIILNSEMDNTYNCFFTLKDGYSFDDVQSYLDALNLNPDVEFYINSVEKYLDNMSRESERKEMTGLFVYVTVIVCLILSCFEINTILAQRREFGILLAYGLSHRDIIKMVLIDNIKKMIIAILIMTCVIAGKLAANIMVENMTFYMLKNTIYSRLILTIGMIGILLVLLVCIVPSNLLKKISPAELLGGK